MIRKMITLGLTILLASCATTNGSDYTKTVQTWKGGNVKSLVSRWGVPDSRITSPTGNTAFVYNTQSYRNNNTSSSPAIGVKLDPKGHAIITTTPNTNPNGNRGLVLMCTAVFVANAKGTIIDTQIQGNACYGGQGFDDRMKNPNAKIIPSTSSS